MKKLAMLVMILVSLSVAAVDRDAPEFAGATCHEARVQITHPPSLPTGGAIIAENHFELVQQDLQYHGTLPMYLNTYRFTADVDFRVNTKYTGSGYLVFEDDSKVWFPTVEVAPCKGLF